MQKFNPDIAKRVLMSSPLKQILKSTRSKVELISNAFRYLSDNQKAIGYNVIAIMADLPDDAKGEVRLIVQFGDFFSKQYKKWELAYSRRMNSYSVDEESPDLFR